MEPSSRPLYLVCTRKEVNNLLNRILGRKHVVARKGKNGNVTQSTLTSEFIGCRKAGMLQQYHLTAFHVTTWLGHHSSEITVTSEHTDSCLTCNEILTEAQYAMHKPFKQTCKTLIISKVQTCLPGSEKSESSSAKFAAPSPLPEHTV